MKALIIIDMQMEIQHRINAGRDCVNPDAPERIAAIIAAFRKNAMPVLHVRHRDAAPDSPFHFDAAGYPAMPFCNARGDEPVFVKHTSSAFASTRLETQLRAAGISDLIVTGAVAGFCVASTVRAGADLGFRMTVASDAVIGFDLPAAGLSARAIFDASMALLAADFARVTETAELLRSK